MATLTIKLNLNNQKPTTTTTTTSYRRHRAARAIKTLPAIEPDNKFRWGGNKNKAQLMKVSPHGPQAPRLLAGAGLFLRNLIEIISASCRIYKSWPWRGWFDPEMRFEELKLGMWLQKVALWGLGKTLTTNCAIKVQKGHKLSIPIWDDSIWMVPFNFKVKLPLGGFF